MATELLAGLVGAPLRARSPCADAEEPALQATRRREPVGASSKQRAAQVRHSEEEVESQNQATVSLAAASPPRLVHAAQRFRDHRECSQGGDDGAPCPAAEMRLGGAVFVARGLRRKGKRKRKERRGKRRRRGGGGGGLQGSDALLPRGLQLCAARGLRRLDLHPTGLDVLALPRNKRMSSQVKQVADLSLSLSFCLSHMLLGRLSPRRCSRRASAGSRGRRSRCCHAIEQASQVFIPLRRTVRRQERIFEYPVH